MSGPQSSAMMGVVPAAMNASQTAPTRKSLFLRACRGQSVERVPVWMMRQAGRYLPEYRELRQKHPFLEVCKTPDRAAGVSLQPSHARGGECFLYQEPRLMRLLLGKIARATGRYLKAQVAAGASAVQLFDTWCGELSLRDYQEFALPATQLLIAELGLRGVPLILYTKNSTHLLPEVARAGADVLSVDWRVDLAALRREFGARVALQGNVEPCILLGPGEGICAAVQDTIEKTGGLGPIPNLC